MKNKANFADLQLILDALSPEDREIFIKTGLREIQERKSAERPKEPAPLDLKTIGQNPPPAIQWVIKNLLPQGAIGLIIGQTGAGKTYFALNLAIWLASAYLESPFEAERPQKIAFLNNEDAESLLKRRLWQLSQHYYPIWDVVFRNLLVFPVFGILGPLAEYGPHGNPKPSQNFEILRQLIGKYQPNLLILDTFSRFFGLSENSAEDVSFWLFLLEELAKEFDASFLVLHHPRKGTANDLMDSGRGSSVLVSNTRLLVYLERFPNDSKNIVQLSIVKNNYADFYPKFQFQIRDGVFLPVEEKPPVQMIVGILPTAFKKFVSGEVSGRELLRSSDFAEFRDFLKDSTGIKIQKLRTLLPEALEESVAQGVLTCREDGRGKARKKLYKLPS